MTSANMCGSVDDYDRLASESTKVYLSARPECGSTNSGRGSASIAADDEDDNAAVACVVVVSHAVSKHALAPTDNVAIALLADAAADNDADNF